MLGVAHPDRPFEAALGAWNLVVTMLFAAVDTAYQYGTESFSAQS